MTERKRRLTVTVDGGLIDAANQAVTVGRAESVSGWVKAALADRAARDRRLDFVASAVASYEAEFGRITEEEIVALRRADREGAVVVRRRPPRGGHGGPGGDPA